MKNNKQKNWMKLNNKIIKKSLIIKKILNENKVK